MSDAPVPPAMDAAPKARFAVLDSWRGLCAVSIILFHLNAATHFAWLLQNSYVAVDLFFVLSGFVIASAYQDRLTRGEGFGKFVVRRFGRLYPLHLFVLLIYLAYEVYRVWEQDDTSFTGSTRPSALIGDLLFLQGIGRFQETWNFPAWSISLEFWTNIAFGLGALATRRYLLLAAAVAALVLLATVDVPAPVSIAQLAHLSPAALNMAKYVFGFVLGVLTFNLFRLVQGRGWRSNGLIDLAAVAATLAVFVFAPAMVPLSTFVVFAGVVLIFAFENGLVSRFLRRPAWVRLGTLSYSIYLTHSLYTLLFLAVIQHLGHRLGLPATREDDSGTVLVLGGPWVMDAFAAACVLMVVASSYLTFRFVEEPTRAFFNALSARRGLGEAWALGCRAMATPFTAAASFGEIATEAGRPPARWRPRTGPSSEAVNSGGEFDASAGIKGRDRTP